MISMLLEPTKGTHTWRHEGRCRFGSFWSKARFGRPGGVVVPDAKRQALVCASVRETSNEANIAGVLTFDEVRRIAVNVAELPWRMTRGCYAACLTGQAHTNLLTQKSYESGFSA